MSACLPCPLRLGANLRLLPVPGRIFSTATRALGPTAVRQEITLDPLSTNYIFALPGVRRIYSPVAKTIRFDSETADLAKSPNDEGTGAFLYTVVSYPPVADALMQVSTSRSPTTCRGRG